MFPLLEELMMVLNHPRAITRNLLHPLIWVSSARTSTSNQREHKTAPTNPSWVPASETAAIGVELTCKHLSQTMYGILTDVKHGEHV